MPHAVWRSLGDRKLRRKHNWTAGKAARLARSQPPFAQSSNLLQTVSCWVGVHVVSRARRRHAQAGRSRCVPVDLDPTSNKLPSRDYRRAVLWPYTEAQQYECTWAHVGRGELSQLSSRPAAIETRV